MTLKALGLGMILSLVPVCVQAQQAASTPKSPNKLVTGKIIYVAPMPGQLDQWIIQDLRAWGRYQVSGNSEGVDLVLEAQTPPKRPQYTQSEHIPMRRPRDRGPRVLSLTITNWVTGNKVWEAKILNRSRKKDESPPIGPETEIDARNMKPDQVAERCVTLLRQYVDKLEAKPR
ncbi:MAG TPA: hypothetical protein VMI06_02440 [Terriglobia bacterium]|nr:hypothetical protein [Terriglobia bacterium]